jgi:predicted phosphodiesterase
MELFAISDLHVGFVDNRRGLEQMRVRGDARLIVAGDVGETVEQLAATLDKLLQRFESVIWCPGNHEIWQIGAHGSRGQTKYEELVAVCRSRGVLTPEDEYPVWEVAGERVVIAPMFLLYDYSFCPDHIPVEHAVEWAAQTGIRCVDEELLDPAPYPSRSAWCAERCRFTEQRLERAVRKTGLRSILINHYPLKRCLAHLPAIPRFQIWCGTRRTEDWHIRFNAAVAISGHLHIRSTRWLDGCRFEEVSLGYPGRQWRVSDGIDAYLRPVVPAQPPAQISYRCDRRST